jgi:hypothetical protein
MPAFAPYANEAQAMAIGNLTIENRLDRISLHGDLDLTRDQRGLADARQLLALLGAVVASLESQHLPELLPPPVLGSAPNPFV